MRSRARASTLGQNRDQACWAWCGERGLDAGEHRRRRRAAAGVEQQQGACGGTGRQGGAREQQGLGRLTLHRGRFEGDDEVRGQQYLA